MRAEYEVHFQYLDEHNILRTICKFFHVEVKKIPFIEGCFFLEPLFREVYGKRFNIVKCLSFTFRRFKTSKQCRSKPTYFAEYSIRRRRNMTCPECHGFVLHLLEYDSELNLGFCGRTKCGKLIALREDGGDEHSRMHR